MTDAELADTLLGLEHFENRTTWLYRDSAPAGNLTIGIGCLVRDADAACDLLFQGATGPATEAQVRADVERVQAMPRAQLARSYRHPDPAARIELTDHAVNELACARLRRALAGLHALVPGFDDLPAGPRAGLLDLAWCLGLGKLATWSHLLAAVSRQDWKTAAFESHVAGGTDDRNAWRAQRFAGAFSRASSAVVISSPRG